MRRGLLVVIAIAVIAAAVWWWRRDAASHPSPVRDDATTKVSSTRTTEPALPTDAAVATPPTPPSTDDAGRAAPPVEPQLNPPTVQARMAEVHARLQEILHPCLTTVSTHPPADAEFRFSFRLTFANNQATLSDVKLVWSEVNSAELEGCFLKKVTSAHWTQEEPDGSTTIEEAFRMAELKDLK